MTSKKRHAQACRVVVFLATATMLGGCATDPLVSWKRPAATLTATLGPTVQDDARATADAARDAYLRAIETQSAESRQLGNALIVGGALATALALGQASPGAIAGTALLGGTLYTLGRFNIDSRRWLMYQAGIEAFNCAKRAVTPANMTVSDFGRLKQALNELEANQATAQLALAAADAEVTRYADKGATFFDAAKPLRAKLDAARTVIDAGNQVLPLGYSLQRVVEAAPGRLEQTVDNIDDAVRKALLGSLADFTQVPGLIGGLNVSAAAIAPGAGVDGTLQSGLARYDAVKRQSATEVQALPRSLIKAMGELDVEVARVASASATIRGFLGAQALALKQDTLADCSVGDLSFPLSLKPAILQASSADGAQFVLIEGGKPPYLALASSGTTALVVRGPVRNDVHFEVESAPSAVAGKTYNVLVLDSSSPPRSAILPVRIESSAPTSKTETTPKQSKTSGAKLQPPSPPASGVSVGSTTGSSATVVVPDTRSEMQKAVDKMLGFEMPDKSKVTIGNATAQAADGRLTITLSCARPALPKPPQPSCFQSADLRTRVLQTVGTPLTQAVVDAATLKERGTNCVCP